MWRRRFAEISLTGSEALALFMAAAALAAGAGGAGPSLLALVAACFGGFYLVRFLFHFDTNAPAMISAAMAVSLLGIVVVASLQYDPAGGPVALGWTRGLAENPDRFLQGRWPQVWGVFVIAFAWLRSAASAQRDLTYHRATASFTIGLLVVVLLLLFSQGTRAEDAVNAGALPYFMLGLLTFSLVHLSKAEYQQGDFLRGPWVVTLGGTIGTMALISALVGLFPLGLLNDLLAPVGTLLLRILDLAILAIAYPIGLLIVWILSLIMGDRAPDFPPPNRVVTDGAQRLQQQAGEGGPPELLAIFFKALFILTVVSIVGYILWRAFRRLMRPSSGSDETRETLASEEGIGSDLGALLGALLGRFRRTPGIHEPDLPADILAVRRLYVRALHRAEAAGAPRPPAVTPHEFAPILAGALETSAAVALSEQFAAARYGMIAPSPTRLAELERDTTRGG